MSEPKSNPLGPLVSPTPAIHAAPTTLRGTHTTLIPLSQEHTSDLFAAVGGAENASLWDYMLDGPYLTLESFHEAISSKIASREAVYFAIMDPESGKLSGWCSLIRIDIPNRVCEVGNIMYARSLQRTVAGTEAMYLLARHVFEDLGFRRYEWKCNDLNGPSRRAAVRLGFVFEGLFRKHMVVRGRSRDTAWFAMVDEDWGVVKRGFEEWLDEGNFDAEGRQRRGLEECREGVGR